VHCTADFSKMKVLLVTLAVLFCAHQSFATDCASGPSFWCANQENARMCNSESYCNENCWSFAGRVQEFWRSQMIKHNRLPDNSYTLMCTSANQQLNFKSTVCKDCKVIISDLDKLLKNKLGLEGLITAMRFLCNFLPAYSTVCREIVNDIGSIGSLLEPYLNDPEKACEKMKMCPSQGPNGTLTSLVTLFEKVYMKDVPVDRNNTVCDDCQQACQDIIAQLEDPAQQENLKETFEELCDYVGPLKKRCIKAIDEFVPQLINWIISRFTDPLGLCTQLGFCK